MSPPLQTITHMIDDVLSDALLHKQVQPGEIAFMELSKRTTQVVCTGGCLWPASCGMVCVGGGCLHTCSRGVVWQCLTARSGAGLCCKPDLMHFSIL